MRTGIANLPLHGGKDGNPYPVDRTTYDESVEFLRKAVSQARVGNTERLRALKRLGGFERIRKHE